MIRTDILIKTIRERAGDVIYFIGKVSKKSGVPPKKVICGMLGAEELSINTANVISDELNLTAQEFGSIFFA